MRVISGVATETYSYDRRNNILTAVNANISYTNAYDADNRIASVSDSRGYTISYHYDQAGVWRDGKMVWLKPEDIQV